MLPSYLVPWVQFDIFLLFQERKLTASLAPEQVCNEPEKPGRGPLGPLVKVGELLDVDDWVSLRTPPYRFSPASSP